MAKFLSTVQFTAEGVANYRQTTQRAEQVKELIAQAGGEVEQIYWAMGPHDGFLIFSAPDDETASAAVLRVAALGNVTLSTSRLFDASEMQSIIQRG